MISLVENYKTTILITTHYIEEARRANTIGFIRKGQLLAENSPQFLMKKYETSSLERLFFKLCVEQVQSKKAQDKLSHHIDVNFNNSMNEMIEKSFAEQPTTSSASESSGTDDLNELKNSGGSTTSLANSSIVGQKEELFKIPWVDPNDRNPVSKWLVQFFAITSKYFILTRRRPETVLAQYVLPLIAIATFCVCIGSTPTGIKLAVINEEPCAYPVELNAHLKRQPINTIDDFIKKFESFFGGREDPDPDGRAKLEKRSVEITTLNWNIFFNEEEVTTAYPTKFNLMNNLNFHENRDLKEAKPNSPKNLSGDESSSIDRLLASRDSVTTPSDTAGSNSLAYRSAISASSTPETADEHFVPTTDSPIVLVNEKEEEPPVPKPVLSEEHSSDENDEHSPDLPSWGIPSNENFSDWNSATDEKLPNEPNEEEDVTESLADDQMRSHLVNSQFENACFSQLLIQKMNDFIFTKIPYTSHEKAIEDVRSGKIWGVIRIKKGFSRALISKLLFMDYGDVNITDSLVDINADLTNRALIITLEVTLSRLYPDYVREVLTRANAINIELNRNSSDNETNYKLYNINSGRLPIILGEHVFKPKFTLSDFFGIREFAGKFIDQIEIQFQTSNKKINKKLIKKIFLS